jgi:hypothetical protein
MDWKDKEQVKLYKQQWNAQWRAIPENKEKNRQRTAQWRALPECKEKNKQYNKKWYALPENKEKNKEKARQQYATDPMYRLNSNIRRSIWESLKTNNLSKNGRHWETLVNFTLQELKLHLETQFDSNMNWENHGSDWHLDHIIPLSSLTFDSEEHENFKLLWSLGNLQPLFGPENLSKSKKILINFKSLLFPFTAQPVKDNF